MHTTMPTQLTGPMVQSERIIILDSLRGIAVLGILLMNITQFGLPSALATDVSINKETGLNYYVWYIFGAGGIEGSMRALFSILFGASTIIFISRLEARVSGLMPVEIFFRRQLWLLVFGLFNAYVLLWYGDVLFHYAICGLFLFPFRRLKPKYLFIAAGICLLLNTARENIELYKQKAVIVKGEKIPSIDTSRVKLTERQKDVLTQFMAIKARSTEDARKTRIQKQLRDVKGSYGEVYRSRTDTAYKIETAGMFYFLIWDVLLFMFLGMAFYKTGILQGQAKTKVYAWMAVLGFAIGIPLSYLYLKPALTYHHNFFEVMKHKQYEFYQIQRFVHSMAVFGLIMLMYKSGWFKWLFSLMRPVGQMAFTNYLMQSLLCGLFFYGIGFGMFGKLQRYELYYVVAAVWAVQIVWSHLWLMRYRFGPLEWIWRSLTYWKQQQFRK